MSVTAIPASGLADLPVAAIRPSADNPRGSLGDLTDLANSIAESGVWQPVVVTPRDDDEGAYYLLVIGHRRHAAAIKAGRDTIPAIIREMDEPTRLAAMFIENAQREDLTPIEEARSLQALITLGIKQREVAKRVGKSQSHISKRLSLLDLPEEVQAEVDAGRLVVGDAVELARLGDEKEIREVFKVCRYEDPGTGAVSYLHVGRRVADALARQERDKQVKRLTRKLRADGVTVVDYPRGGAFNSAKTGRRLGDGFGQVHLTKEEHAGEPCHAAAVSPDGEVVYACTDPDRHNPTPGTDDAGEGTPPDAVPAEPASLPTEPDDIARHREQAEAEAWAEWTRRERERERAELAAAAERRQAFIRDLVRRKPGNAVTAYILTDFVNYSGSNDRVLDWLGIDGDTVAERAEAFTAYVGQSLANLTRAAYAVVLDGSERMTEHSGFAAFLDTDFRVHLAHLLDNGYEPTDIERRGLDYTDELDDDGGRSEADQTEGDHPERDAVADAPDAGETDEETAEQPADDEPVDGVASSPAAPEPDLEPRDGTEEAVA